MLLTCRAQSVSFNPACFAVSDLKQYPDLLFEVMQRIGAAVSRPGRRSSIS